MTQASGQIPGYKPNLPLILEPLNNSSKVPYFPKVVCVLLVMRIILQERADQQLAANTTAESARLCPA